MSEWGLRVFRYSRSTKPDGTAAREPVNGLCNTPLLFSPAERARLCTGASTVTNACPIRLHQSRRARGNVAHLRSARLRRVRIWHTAGQATCRHHRRDTFVRESLSLPPACRPLSSAAPCSCCSCSSCCWASLSSLPPRWRVRCAWSRPACRSGRRRRPRPTRRLAI